MRNFNRRYLHRLIQSDTARGLLPNPLTRVELPPSVPPVKPAAPNTSPPAFGAPPSGPTPPQ